MIEALQSTAADPEVAIPSAGTAGDQAFPTLNEAQIARIAAHGRARKVASGEVLVKAGARNASFFVVVSGRLDIVRVSDGIETILVVHKPGQVSGELNVLSGRRAVFSIRAGEPGEVIELDHEQVQEIVQTDADLSEILMRAFLLRRARLIASGIGDVVLIGSIHSQETLRIQEFLTRNSHP
jgi:thioredoxin reductase (NADPH)